MTYLLDTQVLLWSIYESQMLSTLARSLLLRTDADFVFSTISVWEVSIKFVKRPETLMPHPSASHSALLQLQYEEVLLTSEHTIATASLPLLHRDPFDRILLAQAQIEGIPLVTADHQLTQYDAPTLYVG